MVIMGQYSRIGVLIINNNNELLLMHRIKNGREYYAVLGGRPEGGEAPQETAVREILEETGLHIVLGKVLCMTDEDASYGGKGLYYMAQSYTGTAQLGGPEKEASCTENFFELAWIKLDKLTTISIYPETVIEKLQQLLSK
jgi:8-oxo-dGTP pyrophosphatase MutT (NUDIX family)